MIAECPGLATAPLSDVIELRHTIVDELTQHASAVLLDPVTAVLPAEHGDSRAGTLLALEDHRMEETPGGRAAAATSAGRAPTVHDIERREDC